MGKIIPPVKATDEKKLEKNPLEDYFNDVDYSKLEVDIKGMFKNGVHFGHHKSRKNPKMSEFIFATKNNINIFDLEKTKEKLEEALNFITEVVSQNKDILFVGTKKQAKKIVELAALKCEMPYVSERWLGGTFTNFPVISKRLKYLRDDSEKLEKGEFSKYTKFEQMKKAEELERLERKMGGIKNMLSMPGAIVVTSLKEDALAVKEASDKNIPIVAFSDSNTDPSKVDYPIPANEDAVSSLKLMLTYIVKAVLEGKSKRRPIPSKSEIKK